MWLKVNHTLDARFNAQAGGQIREKFPTMTDLERLCPHDGLHELPCIRGHFSMNMRRAALCCTSHKHSTLFKIKIVKWNELTTSQKPKFVDPIPIRWMERQIHKAKNLLASRNILVLGVPRSGEQRFFYYYYERRTNARAAIDFYFIRYFCPYSCFM